MRINESTLKPGKLCRCPVVPISRFPVPPRSIQDLLFSTTEDASQLVSISQIPRTESRSVCCPHLGLPFWGGGGRGWGNPGISPGTSPNLSLFALSSWFNDLIQGREGAEELFSCRYLGRLLTSPVFLVMRRAGARLWFLRSELILEVKESSASHNWSDSSFLGSCLEQRGRGGCNGHQNPGCCPCFLAGLQNTQPRPQVLTNLSATWVNTKDWQLGEKGLRLGQLLHWLLVWSPRDSH